MDKKKLTIELLRSTPFPHEDTNEIVSHFDYQSLTVNDLIMEEKKKGGFLTPLSGSFDFSLFLILIGILLILAVFGFTMGFTIYQELSELKNRLPKSF